MARGNPATEADLAVLFVHGIGEQRQGETLRRFGEPLHRWLKSWLGGEEETAPATTVEIRDAALRPGDSTPAHAELALPSGKRILVAESWWADTFHPPGRFGVAAWVAGFGSRAISRYANRRQLSLRRAADDAVDETGKGGIAESAIGMWLLYAVWLPLIFIGFVGLALAVLLVQILLLVLLVLALIPAAIFPPARTALERLGLLLSNVLGDTYALKRSPFALAAMVTSLQEDLDWIEERAARVVVVGHSQGSVVAHRALSQRPRDVLAHFVTVGSALRLLYGDARVDEDEEAIDRELTLASRTGDPVPWTDFYARTDPVSDGRLWRVSRPPEAESLEVRNADSLVRDHTLYWQNADGFVSDLVRLLDSCGELGLFPNRRLSAAVLDTARRLRAERASVLATARMWLLGATVILIPVLGAERVEDVGSLVVSDGASGLASWFAGAAATGAAVAALYALIVLAWSRWNAAVVQRMHERLIDRLPHWPVAAMVVPQSLVLLGIPGLAIALHGLSAFTVGVAGGGIAVTMLTYATTAVANEPTPPDPPRVVAKQDLALGQELAYRDGSDVRRVKVTSPPSRELFPGLRFPPVDDPLCVVEFLDDPTPSNVSGFAKGERTEVDEIDRFAGLWVEYAAWKATEEIRSQQT